MKLQLCVVSALLAIALAAAKPAVSASVPDTAGASAQSVITVLPGSNGARPQNLQAGDLSVTMGKTPARVVRLERLSGDLANLQLFILLDDSTRSSSLGIHLPDLKNFIQSLPPTTQVAVGYMRYGSFALSAPFTTDHQQAASRLRLPLSMPGENGSPYFALSDLAKHWPSKEPAARRAVLMLTDGVDRYWGTAVMDDPYLNEAVHSALKNGVMVYSIYLRGSGRYGRGEWVKDFAQSRLIEVAQQTGGNAWFEAYTDPINIAPFLTDLHDRLDNQYQMTIQSPAAPGVQPMKVKTETPGLKITAPTETYVR